MARKKSQRPAEEIIELMARTSYELPTDPSLEDFRIIFDDLKWQLEYQITTGTRLAALRPLTHEQWQELFWTTQRFCETWNQNRAVALYWRAIVVAGIESLSFYTKNFSEEEKKWFEDLFKKLNYESSHRFSGWVPGLLIKMMSSVVIPVNKLWRERARKDLEHYWMVEEIAKARFPTPNAAKYFIEKTLHDIGDSRYANRKFV